MQSAKLLASAFALTNSFHHSFANKLQDLGKSCLTCRWLVSAKTSKWDKLFADAEQIVGQFPTSLSLKFLLSDKYKALAANLNTILSTHHPILGALKNMLYHDKTNFKIRGLIVLLLSKAAGHAARCPDLESACLSGVTNRQYVLAELIETIYTAAHIHKEVINFCPEDITDKDTMENLQFGNKVSVLIGDMLMVTAIKECTNLENVKTIDLISKSIGDFTEAQFLDLHDKHGHPLPVPGMDLSTWEQKAYLSSASLIANGCKAALDLAGHSESKQNKGYELGKNIALAWQVYNDLQPFVGNSLGLPMDLTSLPVVFHLENNPQKVETLRSEIGDDVKNLDFKALYEYVRSDGSVEKAKLVLEDYSQRAEDVVLEFGTSNATMALSNIINSLRE